MKTSMHAGEPSGSLDRHGVLDPRVCAVRALHALDRAIVEIRQARARRERARRVVVAVSWFLVVAFVVAAGVSAGVARADEVVPPVSAGLDWSSVTHLLQALFVALLMAVFFMGFRAGRGA
jgi:hypothetical protein